MAEDNRDPQGRLTKLVADSTCEAMRIVTHQDVNGENRLFGGRLMEWIDELAGIAARRHCGTSVTTACVDTLTFKQPALLNDIVVIVARVTYVGRTSLEVRVDSYVEDTSTGDHSDINSAYLTEVCVDSDGHPTPVAFGLQPVSTAEKDEWEAAQKRIAVRKQRKAEGF